MRGKLCLAARFAVVAGCLAYVFWDVDFSRLFRVFVGFNPAVMAGITAFTLYIYAAYGLRFYFLARGEAGYMSCAFACAYGIGVNNVLPVRLGELAKILYLRDKAGVTLGAGLGMVFWERFSDLNMVVVLGLASLYSLKESSYVYPLAAVVLVMWAGFIVVKLRTDAARRWIGRLPFEKPRQVLSDTFEHIGGRFYLSFMARLSLATVLVWGGNLSMNLLLMFWAADLPIGFAQALAVFVMAALGAAVPSSPGALGVYEAAMTFALVRVGVDKETALAVAIMSHMLIYVPSSLFALGLAAKSGIGLKKFIRKSADRPRLESSERKD